MASHPLMLPPPGYKFIPKTDKVCGKPGKQSIAFMFIIQVVLSVTIYTVKGVSLKIVE